MKLGTHPEETFFVVGTVTALVVIFLSHAESPQDVQVFAVEHEAVLQVEHVLVNGQVAPELVLDPPEHLVSGHESVQAEHVQESVLQALQVHEHELEQAAEATVDKRKTVRRKVAIKYRYFII